MTEKSTFPSTVFVVVAEPYHENGEVVGVFDTLGLALAMCEPLVGKWDYRWSIFEHAINGDRVRWMSNALEGDGIDPLPLGDT